MQPYNGGGGSNNRAEAERWLGIAEKLLAGRDLVGTKTFAIRARESDPRFDAADLILTVADTLLAGEKQISNQPDWYSILQLPTLCVDLELIANQYRRLALVLNPHKNRLPYADQAFAMVSYAWSVLSDPSKKYIYDNEINMFTRFEQSSNRTNEINLQFVQSPMQQQQHLQSPSLFSPSQLQPSLSLQQMQQLPPSQYLRSHLASEQSQNQQILPPFGHAHLQNQHLTSLFPPSHQQKPQFQTQQHVESESPVNEQQQTNRSMDENNVSEETEMEESEDNEGSTFWTACPYCYYMYEYPGVYKDCTFRCHNCKRAFHGLKIQSPPPAAVDGKGSYFCCWGFIPLAGVMSKSKKRPQPWSPFSQMLPCSAIVKRPKTRKAPVDYNHDEDDIFVDVSSSDHSSDGDWRSNSRANRKKKAKHAKERSQSKNVSYMKAEKEKNVGGDHIAMAPQSNPKQLQGKVPKEWGRLDLNVEFSNNDGEESGSGIRVGGGGEPGKAIQAEEEEEPGDGIEGIGFFEGLDDFFSTLPILNVVGEDNKVKAS